MAHVRMTMVRNTPEYNMRNEIYIEQTNENLVQPLIAVGHDVMVG